jgi:hypothetical protein
MKQMLKGLSDKASNYLDTKGLANPIEVINEELGGETREESKKRREAVKEEPVKKAKGGTVGSASKRADGCCNGVRLKGRWYERSFN